MMKIAGIKTCDTQNGEGLRVTLWTQGCPFRCKGCHNKETWNCEDGRDFTEKDRKYIFEELRKGQEFSILGGEPLIDRNRVELRYLLFDIRQEFPDMKIWLWTGRSWTDAKDKYKNIIKYIDVIVTEKYVDSKRINNPKEKEDFYRGSYNQKIIDVKKSLKENKIIMYKPK